MTERRLIGAVVSCNPSYVRGDTDGRRYFIPASQFVGLAIGDRVSFAAHRGQRAVNIIRLEAQGSREVSRGRAA
jgi:hypothetical protein